MRRPEPPKPSQKSSDSPGRGPDRAPQADADPASSAPDEFPTSLQGGEPREHSDHRMGETQRQNPRVDTVDPAPSEPQEQGGPPPKRGG
jgi:hypothetical protein